MMRFAIFGALLVLSPSSAFASVPMGGLAQQRLHIGSDPLVAVQTDLGVEDSEPEESRGVGVSTLSSVVSVVGPVPELEPAVTTPSPATQVGIEVVADLSAAETSTAPAGNGAEISVGNDSVTPEGSQSSSSETTEDPSEEYLRFFPEEEIVGTSETVETGSQGNYWFWPMALVLVAGAYFWKRKKVDANDDRNEINIVGRASLGREGSLAVVVVGDPQGQPRRLLVGYGGGAPRLVADLADDQVMEAMGTAESGGGRTDFTAESRRNWERAVDDAGDVFDSRMAQSATPRSAQDDLIANVLADREQLRKSLGEMPSENSRAGVRRRAYRGTMA